MKKTIFTVALVLTSLALGPLASTSRASILSYEGFTSYNNNDNLNGKNGGTGWGGAWQVGVTDQGFMNQVRNNTPLSYAGYTAVTTPAASGGNYLNLAAGFGQSTFNFAQRAVDLSVSGVYDTAGLKTTNTQGFDVVGANNKTLWGSFLYQTGTNNTQFWLQQKTAVNATASAQFNVPSTVSDGLLLFRIDYLAGNDNISIWYNPNLATWTPSTATSFAASGDYGFFNFIFVENGNNVEARFDDLRLGTLASDVVPIPEPASLMLLGLGAGLMLMRRKHV